MRLASPFSTHIEHNGEKPSAWKPQVLPTLPSFDASQGSSPGTLGDRGDHRHVNANLSEPWVGKNDVKASTFSDSVPACDSLLFLWVSSDVLKPPKQRVTNVIVALGDTTTDGTPGSMFTTIMTVDEPTD